MSPFPIFLIVMFFLLLIFSPWDADAKVMDGVHDGSCIPISSKYQHQNPIDTPKEGDVTLDGFVITDYQGGFIPKDMQGDNSDIIVCLALELKNWDRT